MARLRPRSPHSWNQNKRYLLLPCMLWVMCQIWWQVLRISFFWCLALDTKFTSSIDCDHCSHGHAEFTLLSLPETFPCHLVLCLLYASSSLPSNFQNLSSCSLGLSPAVDLSRSSSESRVFPHSRYHHWFMDLFKAAVSISSSVKQEVDSEGCLSLLDGMQLSCVHMCDQVITVKILADLFFRTCAASFSGLDRLTQEKETACMQTDGSATFCHSFAVALAPFEWLFLLGTRVKFCPSWCSSLPCDCGVRVLTL